MKLSEHFDDYEFNCNCGKSIKISDLLIERLEKIFTLTNAKAILVTSGYRCPTCTAAIPGAYKNDAHTIGIAADIMIQKQDGTYYSGYDIAEAAERVGFGGIGIMNNACHLDTRDKEQYVNNHWWGNEITGENWIETFQRGTVFPGEAPTPPSIPGWNISKVTSLTWIDDEGNEHISKFE